MPVSFADALKKVTKDPPKPKPTSPKPLSNLSEKGNSKKLQNERSHQKKQPKRKQEPHLKQQKAKKPSDQNNKRQPLRQTLPTNKKKVSKKQKPSTGVRLGDVPKLPSQQQQPQKVHKILKRPQTAPDLSQDFPSLGNPSVTKIKPINIPDKILNVPKKTATRKLPLKITQIKNISRKDDTNAKKMPKTSLDLSQDFPSLGGAITKIKTTNAPEKILNLSKKTATPKHVLIKNTQIKKPSKKEPSSVKKVSTKITLNSNKGSEGKKSKSKEKPSNEATSLLATFGAKQRSTDEENLMGKFLKNPATVKKGKQRLGPRKKRFSTLKKKVLQERLVQWNARNSSQKESSTVDNASFTVAIWKFCLPEEAEDIDEISEILSNLREMAAKVGEIEDLFVSKKCGHAFCLFKNTETAQAAEACWNGLVLGGTKLEAKLLPGNHKGDEWKKWVDNIHEEGDGEESGSINVVILDNILTDEDMEDEECLKECLDDIKGIAEPLGTLEDIQVGNSKQVVLTYRGSQKAVHHFNGMLMGGQVVRARLKENGVGSVLLSNVLAEEDFEDEECLNESLSDLRDLASRFGIVKDLQVHTEGKCSVVVQYEGNVDNQTLCELNNLKIGGQKIHATLLQTEETSTKTITLRNILTEDDLEDADCLEETKADIAELAGKFGTVTRIDVDIEKRQIMIDYKHSSDVVEKAINGFDSMMIGGEKVIATSESKGIDESVSNPVIDTNEEKEVDTPTGPKPMYSGDKLIPERFAECKRVPKIPNAGGATRKYATLVADETVKPLLQDMLGELMRLQKRAVEDKNAKARRRLVMGLREVARGIRSHKVKLVVMANNLDEYGIIDKKLQEIIDLAREESVPIFYEFNKRRLGKAIGKSIKIGVIGLQNADGAYQEFKKLISFANRHGLV